MKTRNLSDAVACRCRMAMLLLLGIVSSGVYAQSVFQITGDITDGLDLTAMEGYYSDRLAGPSAADATVSGEIKHSPDSNPFQIIGYGKKISFQSETSITNVPVLVLPAEGVSKRTDIVFNYSAHFRKRLEFRKNTRLVIPSNKQVHVYGDGSDAVDFVADGGGLYGYAAPVVGNVVGDANLKVLNGSFFYNDYDFYLGKEESPGRNGNPLYVTADIRAEFHARNLLLLAGVRVPSGVSAKECCFVTNGINGTIKVWSIHHSGGNHSRVVFDGGKLISRNSNSNSASKDNALFHATGVSWDKDYPNPNITVESVNGHPIDIDIPVDREFSGGSKNRKVNVVGDGGFVKRGAGVLRFSMNSYDYVSTRSSCTLTGPTKVLGGGIIMENSHYRLGRGSLEVSEGAFFDVNGIDLEFTGATGDGILTNSSEIAKLTLGYGNEDGRFDIPVAGMFSVDKIGSGTLTVGKSLNGFSGNISVTEGAMLLEQDIVMAPGLLAVGESAVFDAGDASLAVSNLSVNASSGTISVGVLRPVANGTLEVSGVPLGSGNIHELSVSAGTVEDVDNFATWTVVLNGKTREDARVYVLNGKMCVSTSGFSIRIR